MRIIVCGGRKYRDTGRIHMALEEYADRDPIISTGGAPGADSIAYSEALELGYTASCIMADWERYGKRAGPIRNQQLIDGGADLLIAFGGGLGTEDCIRRAERADIPVRREP